MRLGIGWVQAEGLKLDPVKDKKNSKIHTLFRTKDKMHAVLFYSQLLAIATKSKFTFSILGIQTNFINQIKSIVQAILYDYNQDRSLWQELSIVGATAVYRAFFSIFIIKK